MSKSKIEWTNRTWNPVTGCTKVSQGCKHCYAETMYERFNGKGSFKNVICHEERLLQPLAWKGKEMCFVNSMSDLFHEAVPFEFIDKVFAIMAMAENITFQILTKRPERMREYFSRNHLQPRIMTECDLIGDEHPKLFNKACEAAMVVLNVWPLKNVWLGVSVEDQNAANVRIRQLITIPAAVRFLSCEPLLGPVDLSDYFFIRSNGSYAFSSVPESSRTKLINIIDWVIVGGESGHEARPMHPDWARSLRDICKKHGVPFLFKQWGMWKPHEYKVVRDTYTGAGIFLSPEGKRVSQGSWWDGTAQAMDKVRKKSDSGRLLDGVLHDEFPSIKKSK